MKRYPEAWLVIWVAGVILPCALFAQAERPFGYGVRLDDAAYHALPALPDVEVALPSRVSMKAFTPYPGDQGLTASGVAWATAYSALTTMQAWQRFETDRVAITEAAWSPVMLYNQLRPHATDPQCQQAPTLTDALWALQRDGTVPHAAFPPSCERTVTLKDRLNAQSDLLDGFLRLFAVDAADKMTPIRQALAHGHPVVATIAVTPSFEQVRGAAWQPQGAEMPYGWQALTIVGYDDDRMGGAVEVLNSWGRFWGDDGFTWIRYADVERLVRYGVMLYQSEHPQTLGVQVEVDGAVERSAQSYQATSDTLGLRVTLTGPGYMAMLAANRLGEVEVLQPTSGAALYIPLSRAEVHLPIPDAFARRSRAAGRLNVAVLAAATPFEPEAWVEALRAASGAWAERVAAVSEERNPPSPPVPLFRLPGAPHQAQVAAATFTIAPAENDTLLAAVALQTPIRHAAPSRPAYRLQARDTTLTVSGTAWHPAGIARVEVQTATGVQAATLQPNGQFDAAIRPVTAADRVVITATANTGDMVVRELDLLPRTAPDWVPPRVTVTSPTVVPIEIEAAQPAATDRLLTVAGTVADDNAVAEVIINGVMATLTDTTFTARVLLPRTERHFHMTVTDRAGNTTHQTFYAPEADEDISLLTGQKAFGGADSAPKQDYVAVQVYYATDRARSGSTKLAQFYGGERGELEFGVAQVSIPEGHTIGEIEKPMWQRFEFRSSPSKHITLLDVAPYDRADVLQSMRQTIANAAEKQVLVFVHGYNVSFASALQRAAQLAHDLPLDGAPFLYSWPSDGSMMAYGADEDDVAWTIPHLVDVIEAITQETGAERVHVLAHSMGNRAVVGALEVLARRYTTPLLDQVVFTAPDIDAEAFETEHVPAIRPLANRLTLYTSAYDKALWMSSSMVHGKPRAGDSRTYLVVSNLLDTVDADQIDMSLVGLGHSYFAEVQSALRDLFDLIHHKRAPAARNLLRRTRAQLPYWLLPTPSIE